MPSQARGPPDLLDFCTKCHCTLVSWRSDTLSTEIAVGRRTIYLTIMSSLDFEEAGHKLMKIQVDPGREIEVVTMILECCSQEKTYIRSAHHPPFRPACQSTSHWS